MSSDHQSKVPNRSMIPVPKTYSLRPLTQTQSIDNLTSIHAKHVMRSPTMSRRMAKNASISRLPTFRTANGKSCPPMSRSVSHISNSNSDLSSLTSNGYQNSLNSNKWKSSGKIYKPKDSQVVCQRFQKYHNNCQTKPMTNFKIYNKFSPYYENESLESRTNGHQKRGSEDFDTNSSISSAEECIRSGRKGKGSDVTKQNDEGIELYRSHSVPEHIQKQNSCDNKVCESLDEKTIESISKRILESIDNEDEDQEDIEDETSERSHELSRQVEIKLLRIVIRHLREKLTQSKSNLDKLTQLSTSNKQMCEAFQKSLSAVTIRAQHLTQQLETKQTELDDTNNQLKDKNLEYEDLNRKYQLLDGEYKKLSTSEIKTINNNGSDKANGSRTDSGLSADATQDRPKESYARLKFRRTSSWLTAVRGSTLSKAFKRRKKFQIFDSFAAEQKSCVALDPNDSIYHLRDVIRQKDMTITDLRLESLATNTRMETLEDQLKNSREESTHLKKNKDILEKMAKMKIIE